MKQKIMLLMLFLIMTSLREAFAQHLTIRMNDGTENTELLSAIQKLSFSDGNLVLAYKSGSSELFGLSLVQKLYFDNQTSVAEFRSNQASKITVYPNPVDNVITVRNIPEGITQVFIFSIDGKLLLKEQLSSGLESIDVTDFQRGFYLLVANGREVKFIKL